MIMQRISTVVLVAVLTAQAAGAQPASSPPVTTDTNTKRAQAHFKQGKAFLEAGVYDSAVKELQAGYALAPLPEFQFNIGQAYRLKGDATNGLAAYQAYLALETEGALADEARTQVAVLTRRLADEQVVTDRQRVVTQLREAAAGRQRAREQVVVDARRAHEEDRARRARGMKIGMAATIVGGVFFIPTLVVGAFELDPAINGNEDWYRLAGIPIVAITGSVMVLGLAYGIPKMVRNIDAGDFQVTPVVNDQMSGLSISGGF